MPFNLLLVLLIIFLNEVPLYVIMVPIDPTISAYEPSGFQLTLFKSLVLGLTIFVKVAPSYLVSFPPAPTIKA